MTGSSGVGGTTPPPEEIPGMGEVTDLTPGEVGGLMHTGVSNLGQLKSILIQYMGQAQGTKYYNEFMTSFGMIMLEQMQQSAQQAQKATQDMRMDTQ